MGDDRRDDRRDEGWGSDDRGDDGGRRKRGGGGRKKAPSFVLDPTFQFNYKDPQQLKYFITDRGKIVPRRVSGLTAKQQRAVAIAIKRARKIALLPYTTTK